MKERKHRVQIIKRKRGRPAKYKPEYCQQAYVACADLGAQDENLAKLFGVSKTSLNNWKRQYPELLASLKRGKDEFDCREVESSLLKRATGYQYEEIHIIKNQNGKDMKKIIIKTVPPDSTAIIFYLKNRQPKRWRDGKNGYQIEEEKFEDRPQVDIRKLTVDEIKTLRSLTLKATVVDSEMRRHD